jgi:4,4'-diaponeurosporenoate glycosyltransferase
LVGWALFWRVPVVARRSDPLDCTVSVVVPVRDEEATIGRLLASLGHQSSAPHEVIVIDDHSDDGTAAVARAAGATVVASEPLPAGWTGKPWACWQGAQRASGHLLLFLDADTWLEPGAVSGLIAAYAERPGLLSVQPYHQMVHPQERLGALFNLITMMGLGAFTILGGCLPPRAAFGPCLLVGRDDYFAVGGHGVAAGAVLEGLPIGRAFAAAGHPVRCLAGHGSVSFRMYPDGLRSMVDGFAKGFATGAGTVRPWLLAAVVAWVVGAVSTTRHLAMALAAVDMHLVTWATMAALYTLQMRVMLSRIGNFGWWPAIFFPAPVAFFLGVFALSVYRIVVRRQVVWKGRSVSTR